MTVLRDQALKSLRPGAQWSWVGSGLDWSGLKWHDEKQTQPTEFEVDKEVIRLTEIEKSLEYREQRRFEYPDIRDQLDDLYKQGVFSPEMTTKIKAVKDKYPKS